MLLLAYQAPTLLRQRELGLPDTNRCGALSMRKLHKSIATVLVAATAIVAAFAVVRARPGGKYRLGMTVEDAQRVMKRYYPLVAVPIDLGPSPSAQKRQAEAVYTVSVEEDGVTLYFNYYRKLIKVEKWSVK